MKGGRVGTHGCTAGLHNSLFTCNSKTRKAAKIVSGEVHVILVDLSSMQLWNTDHGKQKAVQALNDSLKRSVDLYKNSFFFLLLSLVCNVDSLLQA